MIRRTFFVPAQVAFYYYDFFSANPNTHLSQSSIGLLLGTQNPYKNENIPKMLGNKYIGTGVNMNTGYIGDAFMNFGFVGVILFSIILGFILVLLDSITNHVKWTISISIVIIPIFTLVNGALFTALGTKGLLLSIIILFLFNTRTIYNKSYKI